MIENLKFILEKIVAEIKRKEYEEKKHDDEEIERVWLEYIGML